MAWQTKFDAARSWWTTQPVGTMTAAANAEVERMRLSVFARLTRSDIIRDSFGCPLPGKGLGGKTPLLDTFDARNKYEEPAEGVSGTNT
jgi:hypothetical protein